MKSGSPMKPNKEQIQRNAAFSRSSRTSKFKEKAQHIVSPDRLDNSDSQKLEDEEVKTEAKNIASKLSSSVKRVIQRAPMSSGETKNIPIPVRAGFTGGKVLKRNMGEPRVKKNAMVDLAVQDKAGEEVRMLEQDLMDQLNEQKTKRDGLLNLAKAGGSFKGLEDPGGSAVGTEGVGVADRLGLPFLKTRGTVFRDRAQDILDEVKEQKFMQKQMGSFSQLDR